MGRHPRFIPRVSLIEITMRIVGGRMLLRPDAELNAAILGILGRAQHLYAVRIHAYTFMSNHVHLLVTVVDAAQEAAFLRHLNKNIGDAIRRQTGWQGPIWDGRPTIDVITTDEKALERLYYICSNGVKEGLVAHPTEWPGVSSASALLHQEL